MSRHKKYLAADEPNPALDISSLIDVCFLLLIYFLVATTIQKKEVDVRLDIPVEGAPDPDMPIIEALYLKIDAKGAIYSGSSNQQQLLDTDTDQRALPLLTDVLNLYKVSALTGDKLPLIQLWVDDQANQQRVIDVLNTLVGAQIYGVAINDLAE